MPDDDDTKITTHVSVRGFFATVPELGAKEDGTPRLFARMGQPHSVELEDGSYEDIDPTFHNFAMYGKIAKIAHDRFQKGDRFLAQGRVRDYVDNAGVPQQEFVANFIGHNTALTRYTVKRGPSQDAGAEAAGQRAVSGESPEPARGRAPRAGSHGSARAGRLAPASSGRGAPAAAAGDDVPF